MIKIRITADYPEMVVQRMESDTCCKFIDGEEYVFTIKDDDECDFWIIDANHEAWKNGKLEGTCPYENVYLCANEMDHIRIYDQDYVNQFYNFITMQWGRYRTKKIYYANPFGRLWRTGWYLYDNGSRYFGMKESEVRKLLPLQKNKLMSVITSNKAFCQGHRDRLDFVEAIKDYFGDSLDVFGCGINDFEDDWDVIAPYKYHIAIQNHNLPDYWDAKVMDAFLCRTMPIQYSCCNLDIYYDYRSFVDIDIHDVPNSIKTIEKAINSNLYEKSLPFIEASREKMLDVYNPLLEIARIIGKNNYSGKPVHNIFYSEKKFLAEKKLVNNSRVKKKHRVLIWGTGILGEECVLDLLNNVEVLAYVESHPTEGKTFHGEKVISGEEALRLPFDYIIFANSFGREIQAEFNLPSCQCLYYVDSAPNEGIPLLVGKHLRWLLRGWDF